MADQLFLGIECGGTRTVALLADADGRQWQRLEAGPANLRLLTDAQLLRHFKSIAGSFPRPAALGIGMAGMRTGADRIRILIAAAKAWPHVPCVPTDDLVTALAAAPGVRHPLPAARILILSGTGSCCYGRNLAGRTTKIGGWGHLLGDSGSGYEIAMSALKAVVAEFDRVGKLPKLGVQFLRALQLNEPDQFIAWAQGAGKTEISALAVEVFASTDKISERVLDRAAASLGEEAIACARRLAKPGERVEFFLAGGNLLKQPRLARFVTSRLKNLWPGAVITPLRRESAWGAVELARALKPEHEVSQRQPVIVKPVVTDSRKPMPRPSELSSTELRNPRSMNLDKLPVSKAVELMLSEDAKIPAALRKERKTIERAIGMIVRAFRTGGRLFYVGAGTSGRLGVLDASECPPTFRTPPELVQGIIAGGQPAIWRAVEGAEDDPAAGARAIGFRGVGRRDVVVGIAASGRTPFVRGALVEARRRGARTVLICFNPGLKISRLCRPHLIIAPDIGPEVLTGSTRLKAGTSTKLLLNMFTTLAMVRLGKVVGNLMVGLNPGNAKLRERAVRILRELTGADEAAARTALEKSGWVVKAAVRRL